MHWTSIPVPAKLSRRPKDARGYPIPAGALVQPDGTPDFKVIDVQKWTFLVTHHRCGLCGEPLGRHQAFVGGPLSHQSRLFTDLPMHKECATYALQVCPYLAAPRFKYAENLAQQAGVRLHLTDIVEPTRPEKFFLATTRSCTPMQAPDGSLVLQAAAWESCEWWKDGARVPA